jgi:hypothetical protein
MVLLGVVGCGSGDTVDTGQSEGASTAAQDPRVAQRRSAFAQAGTNFAFDGGTTTARGVFPGTMWHCTEVGARKDIPFASQAVTYRFTKSADAVFPESFTNDGTGFGKIFVEQSVEGTPGVVEKVGFTKLDSTDEIVELEVMRSISSAAGVQGGLIIERVMKRATAELTPAGQAAWDFASRNSEKSVSEIGELATAYVFCNEPDRDAVLPTIAMAERTLTGKATLSNGSLQVSPGTATQLLFASPVAFPRDITVDVSTVDGTAKAGPDFSLPATKVTIVAGSVSTVEGPTLTTLVNPASAAQAVQLTIKLGATNGVVSDVPVVIGP